MQISEDTINVLKNFATINPSIRFQEGNVIKTCSIALNVMAVAVVNDNFPKECHIYDLNRLLGTISLFEDAEIVFNDEHLRISEGDEETSDRLHKPGSRYTYTDKQNIVFPPEKDLPVTNPITFNVPEDEYVKLMNGVAILGVENVVIRGKDGILSLVATEFKDKTSNEFGYEIGETDHEFEFVFKAENFKFIPDEYVVSASHETNVAHFKGNTVEYWVAIELDSYFNE